MFLIYVSILNTNKNLYPITMYLFNLIYGHQVPIPLIGLLSVRIDLYWSLIITLHIQTYKLGIQIFTTHMSQFPQLTPPFAPHKKATIYIHSLLILSEGFIRTKKQLVTIYIISIFFDTKTRRQTNANRGSISSQPDRGRNNVKYAAYH